MSEQLKTEAYRLFRVLGYRARHPYQYRQNRVRLLCLEAKALRRYTRRLAKQP